MQFSAFARTLFLLLVGAGVACGTHPGGGATSSSNADDASTKLPGTSDAGPVLVLSVPDGSTVTGTLAIAPLAPVLTVVVGQAIPSQVFTATIGGQPATGATWSTDRGELGTVDATGTFVPRGTIGGVANVTATAAGQTATTTVTVNLQSTDVGDPAWSSAAADAGAGGYGGVGGNGPGAPPSASQMATLDETPAMDAAVSLLYPYDGTVWPQGLLAPLLQWNPGGHTFDAVYVHIQEGTFEYNGYFASNTKGPFVNLPLPQAAWDSLGFSNKGEPAQISLVFAEGTKAYGPYSETWTIAQTTLQGSIYYNSYGTALVKNSDTLDSYNRQYGAGTLAIAPRATAPTLVAGVTSPGASGNGTGCRVCHTVAANGQSLLTQASDRAADDYSNTVGINIANDTTGGAGTSLATTNLAFPAFYKDGSLLFSSSGGFTYLGARTNDTAPSILYTVPAGTPVAGVTGLPSGLQAALPSFSPDGAHLSFNFWDGVFPGTGGLAGDQASLAMLDFDGRSAFSNPRVLYTPPAGTVVTYSSFFPNAAGIVFEVELSNPSGDWGYTWKGITAELWWADVASGMAHRLDALNGYQPSGAVYLPPAPTPSDGGAPTHTPAEDVTLNYEATVNPIASGGYAWVVFTSRRMYGNVAQLPPWTSDPRNYAWQDEVTDKKLWVAAIDLNGKPGSDPSHPAFYLPAQELHAGNSRGYWTVEPCRSDGQSCSTGTQCCGGYCQGSGDGGLQCTAQPPPCSNDLEKCSRTSDCCGAAAGLQCINDVCTAAAPPR